MEIEVHNLAEYVCVCVYVYVYERVCLYKSICTCVPYNSKLILRPTCHCVSACEKLRDYFVDINFGCFFPSNKEIGMKNMS